MASKTASYKKVIVHSQGQKWEFEDVQVTFGDEFSDHYPALNITKGGRLIAHYSPQWAFWGEPA